MVKEIIINVSSNQIRIAITEDGNLVDFFVEHPENRRTVGDIYLGKVARVLPGIKAAFIDIGMKHDAFLHFSDISEHTHQLQDLVGEEDDDTQNENGNGNGSGYELVDGVPKLAKGEDIIVQITKEPVKNKGVRVTSAVSLAGRFCVLLPFDNKIGISKKISDFKERKRLRSLSRSLIPKNCGLIIRTVARNQPEEAIKEDLKQLTKIWLGIEELVKKEKPPTLLFQDMSTTSSVIRDLFTHDVSKVFIDSKKLYKQIKSYFQVIQPEYAEKVEFHKSDKPIFETFKIDEQIKTLFGRKVPLKNGGYLIIEHTEAMVVIDVNSGRYAANKDQETNSLKTDIEAAREICRQLRLRDIGGIIVVDFIDLEEEKNRKKIFDELKKEFRRDRAKVSVLPMSDFGLVQITRQRIRQNINQAVYEPCPYCDGSGLLTKKSHTLYDIETQIQKIKTQSGERSFILQCHPIVASKLREGRIKTITKLQLKYFVKIKIEETENLSMDKFKILSKKSGEELTED